MFKRNSIWAILGLVFSIFYLIAELSFNLSLVDFLNSKNTEITTFQKLEYFGRILSSLGFSLFLTKIILNYSKKHMQDKFIFILFVSFGIGFYIAQTLVFNAIVANMSKEQKLSAYTLGVYNNLNINSKVENLLESKDDKVLVKNYNLALSSTLGLVAYNNKDFSNNVEKIVKEYFYIQAQKDYSFLEDVYAKIHEVPYEINNLWNIYVIESRRYENYSGVYKNKYKNKFIEKIGVPPSLNKEDFIKEIKRTSPIYQQFLNSTIIPAYPKMHLTELKIKDIPEDLNKEQWINFVVKHYENALEKSKLIANNIEHLPYSKNIISSVVITPIAIFLSLIVFFLNIGILLGRIRWWLNPVFCLIIALTSFLWSYNPFGLSKAQNSLLALEAQVLTVFKPYSNFIHNFFVNDTNPDFYNIIKIEKPSDINFSGFGDLKDLEEFNLTENSTINPTYKIDDTKVNDKNYYGEINKENPYLKKQ